jgi:CheY-like chemotaxis protein
MPHEAASSLPPELRRLSFLVAEQNPALQKSIVSALQAAGASRVLAAADGNAAWNIWKNGKQVDLFLCASNLPDLSGQELLQRLRADKEIEFQPAFILLSSESSEEATQQALSKGADVVLRKPFPSEQLIPKVIEAIELRRKASGKDAFTQRSLEQELLKARLPVVLIFERYTTQVECEELSIHRCVIRVNNNYGLGTQLNLGFRRPEGSGEPFYKPIKGVVMKTERVPREIGVYRLHVQFNTPAKEQHGIQEILRSSIAPAAPA